MLQCNEKKVLPVICKKHRIEISRAMLYKKCVKKGCQSWFIPYGSFMRKDWRSVKDGRIIDKLFPKYGGPCAKYKPKA